MNKNFDGEGYLPQQFFPLSPLSMLLCQNKTPMNTQSFQTTLSEGEGGGERERISAILSVFPYKEIEKHGGQLLLYQLVLSKIVVYLGRVGYNGFFRYLRRIAT